MSDSIPVCGSTQEPAEQPVEPAASEQPVEPAASEQPVEPAATEQPVEPAASEQPALAAQQPVEPALAVQPTPLPAGQATLMVPERAAAMLTGLVSTQRMQTLLRELVDVWYDQMTYHVCGVLDEEQKAMQNAPSIMSSELAMQDHPTRAAMVGQFGTVPVLVQGQTSEAAAEAMVLSSSGVEQAVVDELVNNTNIQLLQMRGTDNTNIAMNVDTIQQRGEMCNGSGSRGESCSEGAQRVQDVAIGDVASPLTPRTTATEVDTTVCEEPVASTQENGALQMVQKERRRLEGRQKVAAAKAAAAAEAGEQAKALIKQEFVRLLKQEHLSPQAAAVKAFHNCRKKAEELPLNTTIAGRTNEGVLSDFYPKSRNNAARTERTAKKAELEKAPEVSLIADAESGCLMITNSSEQRLPIEIWQMVASEGTRFEFGCFQQALEPLELIEVSVRAVMLWHEYVCD